MKSVNDESIILLERKMRVLYSTEKLEIWNSTKIEVVESCASKNHFYILHFRMERWKENLNLKLMLQGKFQGRKERGVKLGHKEWVVARNMANQWQGGDSIVCIKAKLSRGDSVPGFQRLWANPTAALATRQIVLHQNPPSIQPNTHPLNTHLKSRGNPLKLNQLPLKLSIR